MENLKRTDPLTGELFTPKRSNQFYANRKNQIRFNNEKQKLTRKENATANRFITANKKILRTILGEAKEVVRSKDYLLGAGFRFDYFTNYTRYGNGWVYSNYEYCIVLLENNNYKIFKNV